MPKQKGRSPQIDAGADQIAERLELGADKFTEINTLPSILEKQVLARSQRLHTPSEAIKEVLRVCGERLAGYRLHQRKHILRAMVHLAHEKTDLIVLALAFGDIAKLPLL